jgi:hypothetical protein
MNASMESTGLGTVVPSPAGSPPLAEASTGEGLRLATIPRSHREELRISIDQYQGRPFVSVRVWVLYPDGWHPTKKGTSVRRSELREVISALSEAVDLTAED